MRTVATFIADHPAESFGVWVTASVLLAAGWVVFRRYLCRLGWR